MVVRSPYTPYSIYLRGTIYLLQKALIKKLRALELADMCFGLKGLGFRVLRLRVLGFRVLGFRLCS